jgi:outer membrane autotransporter protein
MNGKPKTLLCLATTIVMLLGGPVSLRAQDVPSRRGPFLGFGFGYGSAKLSCTLCQESREGDVSGFAKMGYALTEQFLLGLEVNAWYDKKDVSKLLGSFGVSFWMYPSRTNGFYIKAGGGLSKYSASKDDDHFKTSALSGQVGVGYDVAISKSVALGPYANFIGTSSSEFHFNNTVVDGSANSSLIQVGLSVTFH